MSIQETSTGVEPAIKGENTNTTPAAGVGVHGVSRATGVLGESETWHGVVGFSKNGGFGVYGKSPGAGVVGESTTWHGVSGISQSTTGGFGVHGKSPGAGVVGESSTWHGVGGFSESVNGGAGVYAEHKANGTALHAKSMGGFGVFAESQTNEAVHGVTQAVGTAAIAAFHGNPESDMPALYARKEGTRGHAGVFMGNVWVHGVLDVDQLRIRHADFAEEFAVTEECGVEPGMVMVLREGMVIAPCDHAYDRCVAGVVSGAGRYQAGVLLDRNARDPRRHPVALLGKVCCWVDADIAPVEVGDLLTTSATRGHAMKVADPRQALGAIVGKALAALPSGRGLVPILITLL